MQLELNPELETFRQEVRAFLRASLPREMAERQHRACDPAVDEDGIAWQRILHRKGWSVPHWPLEYGGCGWSPLQMFIFEEECHNFDAPVPAWQNTHMVGPVIYTFGSEEQKRRFLPPIVRGDYQWAQGFSEPSAGSDLASLRTAAVRDGDHYIVRGQKIWTSGAHHSEWGFFLVRTNPDVKPQAGISFLLIDLKTPGITIRQIPQINGAAHLCEVFLDEVRVPAENLVGQEGQGWSYAKFLLDHERTASSFIYWNKRELQKVKQIARQERLDGVPLIDTPVFRGKLVQTECELHALEWSVLRILAGERFQYPDTAVASVLKVHGSQLQQRITDLGTEALGGRALRMFDYEPMIRGDYPDDAAWPGYVHGRTAVYFAERAATIYGGALQVQKNIIAKLAFGF
jgi:alkylation response protein AidB-like acyl-CoA dehydrogenase